MAGRSSPPSTKEVVGSGFTWEDADGVAPESLQPATINATHNPAPAKPAPTATTRTLRLPRSMHMHPTGHRAQRCHRAFELCLGEHQVRALAKPTTTGQPVQPGLDTGLGLPYGSDTVQRNVGLLGDLLDQSAVGMSVGGQRPE